MHVNRGVGGWGCKHQSACSLPLFLHSPLPLRVPAPHLPCVQAVQGSHYPCLCAVREHGERWEVHKGMPPFLSSPPPLTRIGQRAQDPVPPHPVYGQRGTGRAGQSLSRPSPALMCTLAECRGGQGWGTASPLPAAGEPTDEEDCMRPCCCMAPIRWNNPPLSPCPSTVAPNGVWGVRPPFPTPRVCASRAQGWAGVGERRPCPLLLGGPQMRRTARAPIAMQHPSAGTPLPPSPPMHANKRGGRCTHDEVGHTRMGRRGHTRMGGGGAHTNREGARM
jgi:hypothetical protein